jgi:hypothetical protein
LYLQKSIDKYKRKNGGRTFTPSDDQRRLLVNGTIVVMVVGCVVEMVVDSS